MEDKSWIEYYQRCGQKDCNVFLCICSILPDFALTQNNQFIHIDAANMYVEWFLKLLWLLLE